MQSVLVALLLALASGGVAAERASECELMETTYRVDSGNTAEIIIHQRWKALTAQGRAAVSRIQVAYVAPFEEVEFRSIRTIKKDGTVVDGAPASAFDAAPSEDPRVRSYTDTKLKTILPPNLDTGDSVEYEVVKHIRRFPKPGEFWLIHYWTTTIPVAQETVVLDLSADRRVAFFEGGPVQGKTETANGRRIERWEARNTQAAKPRADGVEPVFAVSSMLSWDAFGKWIESLNQSAVQVTPEITALAAKLTAQKTSEAERIAALYTYVAIKVRYVALAFGMGRLEPHAAAEVLRNGYGDCKDQTALLSALLKAAGFQAHAVLTTPGAGVRTRDVPQPLQFNHEFTAVETKAGLIFLDTAMGPAPPQTLMPGVRGRSAVLIGGAQAGVIEIPAATPVPTRTVVDLKGRVTAAGAFEGTAAFELQGVVEGPVRRSFLDATEAEKEKFLRQYAGPDFRNASVRQISSSDPADLSKPFRVQCELYDGKFVPPESAGVRMTLGWGGLPLAAVDAVAKPQKPVPSEPFLLLTRMDLTVDPVFTIVDGVPVHRKAAFGSFDSEFSYRAGHLTLARRLELKGIPIAPAEWDAVVEFMHTAQTEGARGFSLERHTQTAAAVSPGLAALGRHDYAAAVRLFEEETRRDPRSRTAWNNLGRAYGGLKQYHKAIACFRKQIEIVPLDPYAHDNLSFAYASTNQWEKARTEAAVAVSIHSDDAIRWYRLGRAQAKTGQAAEAQKSYERALALPHEPMLENNIAYEMADAGFGFDKAWQLISAGLEAQAGQVCEPSSLAEGDRCAAQLRELALMLDTAGWVLHRQGKTADAEAYLKASEAIMPQADTEAHLAAIRGAAAETRQAAGAVRVQALVDAQGKVLEARGADDKVPAVVVEQAKAAVLPPIAWPEHSLRTLRTLEFRQDGGGWSLVRSYIVQPEAAAIR